MKIYNPFYGLSNPYPLFILLLFLFGSCKEQVEEMVIEVPTLRVTQLYDYDSVSAYKQKYGDQHREMAEQFAEKSRKWESTNLDKAIWQLQRSLTLLPQQERYRQLGQLFLRNKQYQHAYETFEFLCSKPYINGVEQTTYILGKPEKEDFAHYALCHFLNYGYVESSYVIERAKENGWSLEALKSWLQKNPFLNLQASAMDAAQFELLFLDEEGLKKYQEKPENFRVLLASFKDTGSTSVYISREQVAEFDYTNLRAEYWGPDPVGVSLVFLQEKIVNPDAWINYNLCYRRQLENNRWALLYAVDTSAFGCPKDMRHIYYRLMICTEDAQLLSHQVLAWQDASSAATLNWEGDVLEQRIYKRTWRTPYQKADFSNELLGESLEKTISYRINEEGKIVLQE